MSARAAWLGLLLSAAGCRADATPRTEILLVVDSDLRVPEQLDQLELVVDGPEEQTQSASAALDRASNALPRSLALVHEGGPLGPLHATVQGKLRGELVLTREARLSFVAGQTLVLPMHLVARCLHVACADGTCTERGCENIVIDPGTLSAYAGEEPGLEARDASAGELDAGDTDGAPPDPPDAGGGDDATTADAGAVEDASALEPAVCTPLAEQCNGSDDDCDGQIDDGFDLQTNANHCGACGMRCSGFARACCAGVCRDRCR